MEPTARIALIAAPLLVAGSVAGFLVVGGAVDEGFLLGNDDAPTAAPGDGCSVPSEFSFPSDAEVETWSGDVPADASGGVVKAGSWFGGAYVAPSDDGTYRVEIAEVDPRDNLEPSVEAGVEDGAFSLVAKVEHTNTREVGPATVSASTSPDAEAHVKVWVPDKVYQKVVASSTQNQGIWVDNGTQEVTVRAHPQIDPEMDNSTETDTSVVVRGLQAGKAAADAYNRPAALVDVEGDKLLADSYNAQAVARNVAGGNLTVDSYNGPACAQGVEAGHLKVDSYNGAVSAVGATGDEVVLDSYNAKVTARDLRAAQVKAYSYNAAVDVALTPTASGSALVDSYNAEASLTVATGDAYGYKATADTYNGDAEIDLPNATTSSDDEEHGGETVTAKTQGYESRDIQMELTADSYNGDAVIRGR